MAIDLQAYPGYAGWNPVEAEADFRATGGVGKAAQGGGGVDSIDMSQVPSVSGYLESDIFPSEDVASQAITKAMQARENPLDIYSRLEEQVGLPGLRATSKTLSGQIASVEDYLDMIEPDVTARSRESLVTEAQRRGIVSARKEPFLEKLAKLVTGLGRVQTGISQAEQGIGTKTSLALRGQEMEIEPLQWAYTTLIDRNARKLTGFTANRQTKLDALYDKLNRQRTLSDREWQLTKTLESENKSYLKQLQTAAAQAGYKVTGQESSDQLLGIIGKQAAEQIAFERKQASKGSESSTNKAAALVQLRKDVAAGATDSSLQAAYGGILEPYQIAAEYNAGNMAKLWGPANVLEDISLAASAKKGATSGGLE